MKGDIKKRIYTKVPLFLFNVLLIYLFFNGLLQPEKTHYWIVIFGIPILIFEASTLLIVEPLMYLSQGEQYRREALIFLILVVIAISSISFAFNIQLLFYYFVSIIVKYLSFRAIKDLSDIKKKFLSLEVVYRSLVWAIIPAGVLSLTVGYRFFLSQATKLSNYVVERHLPTFNVLHHPLYVLFVTFFGICYFLFVIVFDSVIKPSESDSYTSFLKFKKERNQ